MPTAFQLGPLYLNGAVLAHIIAGVAALFMVRLWLRKQETGHAFDVLSNSLILIVLCWKFGWAIFKPSLLWEEPRNLLLLSGSAREVWLGVAVALLYCGWTVMKRRVSWRVLLDVGALAALVYISVQSLLSLEYGTETSMPWGISPVYEGLSYHPIHLYRGAATAVLLVWLWSRKWQVGHGQLTARGLLYYGIIKLGVSFFDREPSLALYLTFDQLIALLTILLGYVMGDRSIIKLKTDA